MGNSNDPVCGIELTYMNRSARTEYLGEPYYFCSLRCRDIFDKFPARFAAELRQPSRGRMPPNPAALVGEPRLVPRGASRRS